MENHPMNERSQTKRTMKMVETIFDLLYLSAVFCIAWVLLRISQPGSIRYTYAIMSFILGFGDSFHLLPRIFANFDKKGRKYIVALGAGKFVTSITMTVFYLFLWEIGLKYYRNPENTSLSIIVYGVAVVRIMICFLPYNRWMEEKSSYTWGVIRNIPFVVLGTFVMALYIKGAWILGGSLSYVWIAIGISFLCYIPVVLLSNKYPKIGMLMLPKSCAYVAILLMGLAL